MVVIKVVSIFLLTGVGFGTCKLGWLPRESAKYFSKFVVNIACPAVVLSSMLTETRTTEKFWQMLIIAILCTAFYFFSLLIAIAFRKIAKLGKEDGGIFSNFLLFTNNGFLGFPIALVIFGKEAMFAMVIANTIGLLFLYTLGAHNLGIIEGTKSFAKHFFSFPVVSSLVAILLFALGIKFPTLVISVLDLIGACMAPLAMLVIGIQLADSHLIRLIKNLKLFTASILRLVVIPGFIFAILIGIKFASVNLGFDFGLSKILIGVITLSFLLPCAAVPATLAEMYGKNGTLAAEGVFLSTGLSILTITLWTAVLQVWL